MHMCIDDGFWKTAGQCEVSWCSGSTQDSESCNLSSTLSETSFFFYFFYVIKLIYFWYSFMAQFSENPTLFWKIWYTSFATSRASQ